LLGRVVQARQTEYQIRDRVDALGAHLPENTAAERVKRGIIRRLAWFVGTFGRMPGLLIAAVNPFCPRSDLWLIHEIANG